MMAGPECKRQTRAVGVPRGTCKDLAGSCMCCRQPQAGLEVEVVRLVVKDYMEATMVAV